MILLLYRKLVYRRVHLGFERGFEPVLRGFVGIVCSICVARRGER